MDNELQGTDDWKLDRCGKVTASRVADVIARTKSGYGASRAAYMADLLCERLTGRPMEGFQNAAMLRGTEIEPVARRRYSIKTGNLIENMGFVTHPFIPMSGASPDGKVAGQRRLIELKCPHSHTHFSYIESRTVPKDYLTQQQWQMACTGAEANDFVSFDDRVPENLQLLIIPVERDDAYIAMLEQEVEKFLDELAAKEKLLRETML